MWRKISLAGFFPSLSSISPGGSFGVSEPHHGRDETTNFIKSDSLHDVPSLEERKLYFKEAYSDRSSISWRERLKLMWRKDEWNNRSPEMEFVKTSTYLGISFGFCLGSYLESSKVYKIFLEKHKHSMFEQPREAQVALQDRVILAFIKGGWKYGWRIGVLVAAYTTVTQSLSVARNYINPLDHMLAGGVVGGLWKFPMGPRGMVGGAFAGSIMGIQGGVLMWLFQKASGETVEEKWRREFEHVERVGKINAAKRLEGDDRLEIVKNPILQIGDEETAKSGNSETEENKEKLSSFDRFVHSVIRWTSEMFGNQPQGYKIPDNLPTDDNSPPKP